mmetsp:Transcript_31547/g.48049  ORF Transcript_31547/g.48049 Transcript_31547/m.48049 type:complete len:593 (+) Transcript_31547:36-1814(+)
MGSTSKTDLSDTRSSAINRIGTTVGKSGYVVTSIDDFYRKQKADKVGATKKKGEAANILHGFRGNSAGNMTKKTSIRNPVLVQQSHDLAAANRAAAARYVRSDDVFEPGVVKNLNDFYDAQKYQRHRLATAPRMEVNKHYHKYSSLSSNTAISQNNSGKDVDANNESSVSVDTQTEAARQKEIEAEPLLLSESGRQKKNLKIEALNSETRKVDINEFQHERLGDSSELSNSNKKSPFSFATEAESGRQTENLEVEALTCENEKMNGDEIHYHRSTESSELSNLNKESAVSVVTKDGSARLKESLQEGALPAESGIIDVEIERERLCEVKKEALTEAQNRRVIFDFRTSDYRSFIFVVHEQHGLLLLHCTRKKNKAPHHQLPGGHIDKPEFLMAAAKCQDAHAQLIIAAQAGAARELYEETGIDVRDKVFRLEPAALRNEVGTDKSGKLVMTCELKKRLYFFLPVTDEDFLQDSDVSEENDANLIAPMSAIGSNLRLKLSIEHSGFEFEKDPEKSAELLKKHSGGKGSKALLMAIQRERKDEPTSDLIVEKAAVDERNMDLNSELGSKDESPVDLLPPPTRNKLSCCWKFCSP